MTASSDNRRSPAGPLLGLVTARGGSKGIPRKNILPLAGKPLVQYACQCGVASRWIDRTIVSTDCDQIADAARQAGAETPFVRPTHLAGDDTPSLDVVLHALDWLQEHESWRPAYVVLLQPTAPLRTAFHVDEAIERLLAVGGDSLVSVARVASHNHPDWQLEMHDGCLVRFGGRPLASIPTRRQLLSPTFVRNGAIYIVRRDIIQQRRSLYGDRPVAYEMPSELSVNIDTPEDWRLAEARLAARRTPREAA